MTSWDNTADGRNPASTWMVETLLIMEQTTYQLVIRNSSIHSCKDFHMAQNGKEVQP